MDCQRAQPGRWTHVSVLIRCTTGPEERLGWAHPAAAGLVVHRAVRPRGATEQWTVTHAASGLEVRSFRRRRDATRAALAIGSITDWTRTVMEIMADESRSAIVAALDALCPAPEETAR